MTRWLLMKKAWVLVLLAGAMPLATVSTCDVRPGGGATVYFDDGGDFFDHGYDDSVVIVEDVYYEEEFFYDDPFCDPFFFECF